MKSATALTLAVGLLVGHARSDELKSNPSVGPKIGDKIGDRVAEFRSRPASKRHLCWSCYG